MNSEFQAKQNASRIAGAIQKFFQMNGELAEEDLESLHNQFVNVVEATNARLRKCDELMRKGLRSEAIQEAEVEPNLFDIVAELDIEEWENWRAYVIENGLAPQPDLLVEIAFDLNEAYTIHQPLEKLLRKHRVYALARGPLKERIKILRAIAQIDSGNQFWVEDLRSYEKARLTEIENELVKLARLEAIAGIENIYRELKGSDWSLKPPESLIHRVEGEYIKLQQLNATRRLIELETGINKAFGEFDLEAAKQLRQQWLEIEALASGPEKMHLHELLRPAFEWIDDEETNELRECDRRRAVMSLEAALDDDSTSKSRLQRLMNSVARFDEAVQPALRIRYDERIRVFELREKRKFVLVVISALSLLTLSGVGLWWAVAMVLHRRDAMVAHDTMKDLLDSGQIKAAQAYLSQLEVENPAIAKSSNFEPLRHRLMQLESQDNMRAQSVKEAFDSIKREIHDNENLGWENLDQIDSVFKQLNEIVLSVEEELICQNLRGQVEHSRGEIQRKTNEKFVEDVEDLKRRKNSIPTNTDEENQKLLDKALEVQRRARVSPAIRMSTPIDRIVKEIEATINITKNDASRNRLIAAIKQSIGSPANFRSVTENYVRAFPADQRSRDFSRVLKEGQIEFVNRISGWNTHCADWNRDQFDATRIRELLQLISRTNSEFVGFPSADHVTKHEPFLMTWKNRIDSEIEITLNKIWSEPLFDLNCVIDQSSRSQRIFYFRGAPDKVEDSRLVIRYFLNLSLTNDDGQDGKQNSTRLVFPTAKLKVIRPEKIGAEKYFGPAPHKSFANMVIDHLNQYRSSTFEEKICYLLIQLKLNLFGMDSIIQGALFKRLVELGSEGSSILNNEFMPYKNVFDKEIDLARENFIIPEEARIDSLRNDVARKMERIASPDRILESNVRPALKTIGRPSKLMRLSWIGVALKNEGGSWETLGSDIKQNGRVFARVRDKFVEVGRVRQGKSIFSRHTDLLEGLPLFLQENSED
ncbi:MAG TPA: hypothetical protein PKD64_09225 [Pirellulaceae bacterium]|nr:hypothetical protein [Pirellulaceae bacterium]HMO92369.1 hypothetical protein [Pirellulaceae bacterium]HMP70768.1 hypothetical protein [Pirellulaceae bacterium]